ncbi:uncharacterized protein FIBRA_00263 [Fibroporia radiculosa]|uniref:Myb-like domain-containing protein n=1 Tax=Fibroporia radiculosa TaxID=599839 RepID=J7S5W5_9APHY|nr:uncharacterized protein FIBRA_00263 [Fibroporia radiculosa]CCL98269.1 predicted protein [Fibroporia radiculosa]
MSTDASPSLSAETLRALQQAVGDANSAANVPRKPKPKRAREEQATQISAEDEAIAKKKKKTKVRQGAGVDATSVVSADASAAEAAAATDATMSEHESKGSEKRDKGKEREEEPEPVQQQDSQVAAPSETEIHTSSADFLSAVVAAASATSCQPSPHGHLPFDQTIPQYVEYSQDFAHYSYAPPHPGPYDAAQPPPIYPDLATLIPGLNFNSSEDLLRSLQEFDISKVASVLRSFGFGDTANTANVSVTGQPVFMPPQGPPPVNQTPVRSDAILGRPPKQKKVLQASSSQPPIHPPPLPSPQLQLPLEVDNPEHAHILANVWMNASKLSDMVKKEGLVYKKGKFSAIEDGQLNAAIEHYRLSKGLTPQQLNDIIFSKERGRETFWQEITSALHLRPIIAVYHHVRRTRHPLSQQGPWSKEEEEELTRIVTEMTVEKGRDIDNDIFWGVVSQRMGNKRGRQQTDTLSTQIKNAGERPRWSQMDAYILVHKVDSLSVRDDSEIDWKLLPDEHWNIWSAHSLQRRWLTMKRSIKGHEEMSHGEIMEILKTKKAQALPPPTTSRKKKNKVTSAEAVVDIDEDVQPEAGSSTVV